MILVSACLAGVNCKYSGGNNENEEVKKLVESGEAILICPEQMGGLTTPRKPAEQYENKVICEDGTDVTVNFVRGAEEALKIAKMCGATKAVLKSKSPSCGCGKVYDGTFSKTLVDGDGVAAKLLKENGIEIISSDDYKFGM